jgi:predicted nucleic acid-binding Zn ribbon protein
MKRNKMKQCHLCGIEIPETSARTKFCSNACSGRDRDNRHRKPRVSYQAIPCRDCGKMFTPKQANSVSCGRPGCKAVHVPVTKHKKCLTCGNEITIKHRKKYCSDRCAAKLRREYEDKACIYCGEMFPPKNSRVQTCQLPECLKIHHLKQQAARNLAEAGRMQQSSERRTTKCPRCERLYEKTFSSGWLGRGMPRFFCNCCSMGYVANNSVANEYSVRI